MTDCSGVRAFSRTVDITSTYYPKKRIMAVLGFATMLLLFSLSKVVDCQAGATCGSGSVCSTGLTCENNGCKLNAGGNCSSTNSVHCKSGTTCESSVCKLNAGGNCSSTNSVHCKSGTTCESSVCITDSTYGGTCTINGTVDSCVATGGDANAVCANFKCACKSGYTGSLGAKCSGAASLASSFVILIAAIFVKTHLE